MQTYGIFGLTFNTATIKTDKDNGRVVDFKWAFAQGVRTERKFTLEHIPTLRGAAQEGGRLRLEVTPRIDGTHLPSVDVPAVLRGNITIDSDGAVVCTTRVTMSDLEETGLSVDLIVNSSNCLECTVSNQPTLAEQTEAQIQEELAANRALEGQEPLFEDVQAEVQQVEAERQHRADLAAHLDDTPALDEPVYVDAGPVPPRLVLQPKQPDEDLPFNLPDTDGAAD